MWGGLMVWETREVCEEARQLCLVSLHLPSLPHTNLKKALECTLPTLYASTGLTPCLHISTMQCTRTLCHCLTTRHSLMIHTNGYPSYRSLSAPFTPTSHIPSHKACGGEYHDMGPMLSCSTLMTTSRSQERPMWYPGHRYKEWLVQRQGIHCIW